ncbi:carbohydrate kinase family protein [Arthrobacter psychrolactophilus]
MVASEDELSLLSSRSDASEQNLEIPALAAELLDRGVEEVVVKLGAAGAEVYTAAGRFHVTALPVHSVDTVGAGDAFTAGYLSGLLDGEALEARLHRGNLMGAFAVSTKGDWEGLPNREELGLLDSQEVGSTQR